MTTSEFSDQLFDAVQRMEDGTETFAAAVDRLCGCSVGMHYDYPAGWCWTHHQEAAPCDRWVAVAGRLDAMVAAYGQAA